MRFVVVDDHEIFRDGLRTVIESRPGAVHSIGDLLRYGFRHGQVEAVPNPRGRVEQA